ncbi:MAG: ABC transporter substrate-binding protein [Sedimentibacter sp.]
MNYLKTSQTQDFKSSANFIETLIEYDQYGAAQPCLATEWSASEDGLTWTFKLREGIKWYDSEEKEYGDVTAADFVYGIKYILDPKNESTTEDNVCNVLKNAREYYNGDITDFSQVGISQQ